MSYFLLYGLFALWVLFDGLNRKMGSLAVLWTLGTLFLGPIILPIYLASRPLKKGEVREGGKAWNILKNFAILWTIVMAIASVAGLMAMTKGSENLTSDAARAGAGIGMALGMGFLAALWFFPTMGAALLGFLMKKNTVVENGPTGPLIGQNSTANPIGGWAGVIGTAIVGLIAVGLASNSETKASTDRRLDRASAHSDSSSGSSGWQLSQKTNAMDDTKEAYVSIDASNEIPGLIGSYRPTLMIQCRKHKPELAIEVGAPLQTEYGAYDTYHVRVKFDDGKPIAQRWTGSTDNKAVFATNPSQLVKQLVRTNTFTFEFTPLSEVLRPSHL